jgi:hypothetical protein
MNSNTGKSYSTVFGSKLVGTRKFKFNMKRARNYAAIIVANYDLVLSSRLLQYSALVTYVDISGVPYTKTIGGQHKGNMKATR